MPRLFSGTGAEDSSTIQPLSCTRTPFSRNYDIATEFSDLVQPISLGYKEASATYYRLLVPLRNMQQFLTCKDYQAQIEPITLSTEYGGPTYVYFEAGYAYVWPAPAAAITDGFQLYYKNSATQIADSVDPPTPAAFDWMYTFWAAHMGFLGDRPSKTSEGVSEGYRLKALDIIEKYMLSIRATHTGQITPDR